MQKSQEGHDSSYQGEKIAASPDIVRLTWGGIGRESGEGGRCLE